MLKARWHLGSLARVPVLPPHQLQPLWLPYVPQEKQDTRWMSVMSWLKGMLVFAWGTAEFSHWWHGVLAIMEHEGKRENRSFYSSGMKLSGMTYIMSHPAEGKFHKYQLSSCPHFFICETLVKVMLRKARPLHPHHFRVTSASAVKQQKKKEVEVQPGMDLRENPENRKKRNFI